MPGAVGEPLESHPTEDCPPTLPVLEDLMIVRKIWAALFALVFCLWTVGHVSKVPARAADWPTWRHDASRSAASAQRLPDKLYLQWVRELPPLKPAWPDQPRMQFDAAYEPVVLGKTLFFGSSRNDCVTALETSTGKEKWRYYVDGPIRFAPAAWEGRIYAASDDGYLYCLDAETGKLLWKFRGGPRDRKILGNERLISTWPARGAPVIADGTVYFAASIWPFMGTFIHALDARTGKVRWSNDGDGSIFIKQPHYADSFAGVAPQGHLVVQGDRLLIPGGRSVPALYHRHTGKVLHFPLAENGRRGGHEVASAGNFFFNGGAVFDLKTGKYRTELGNLVLPSWPKTTVFQPDKLRLAANDDTVFTYVAGACRALDLKSAGYQTVETIDRKGDKTLDWHWGMTETASCKVPPLQELIKAGSRLYGGAENAVLAIDLSGKDGTITWSSLVAGTVARLLAADGRLFAVTLEGRIYCFGADRIEPAFHLLKTPQWKTSSVAALKVKRILEAAKVRTGYGMVWGIEDGDTILELARQSDLHLIVVDPDAGKVQALRKRLASAGLYGMRASAHVGNPLSFELPPYLASLAIVEDDKLVSKEMGEDALKKIFHSLRPFGGVACFPSGTGHEMHDRLSGAKVGCPGAKLAESEGLTLLIRQGPLPGSGNWTHEHADAANTRVSPDELVKAPLGILWFGGPSHDGVLPRHGHGPQPQVIDGRIIVEGVDFLRALDIYTGRLLWQVKLPGVGAFFNNLAHQPGANSSGTNYICMPDGIYVAIDKTCLRLDLDTGKTLDEFRLPLFAGMTESPRWGYLNVSGEYLVAGADPCMERPAEKPKKKTDNGDDDLDDAGLAKLLAKANRGANDNLSSSKHLVVMDRHTGKVLWTVSARAGFRHNGTCVGGGRPRPMLFTIDRLSGPQLARLKRRGEEPDHEAKLLVLDLHTGKEMWSTEDEVFGTWLSYSAKHDMLMEAGRMARDTISDEPRGMRAYQAKDGKVLWLDKAYTGPAMIHGDTILQGQGACDLLTGKLKTRLDPISGQTVPWEWLRAYGCNTPLASQHLLTFRSGAAGFFDLCNDGGTGNLGGFRSSCTNNLIVAGGLLNAPDYTRTCTCSYQNQTSLALVHMPDAELWTYFGTKKIQGPIRRLGINLGAPGDRRAGDGTLWVEHPGTAGYSPAIGVKTAPAEVDWFRRHSARIQGKLNWVASSGVKGLSSVTVSLNDRSAAARKLTVRLHFVEPDGLQPGQRVFHVFLQEKKVVSNLDIAREAGGPDRALVREFAGIDVQDDLVVRLAPSPSCAVPVTILCGIEVVAEDLQQP